MGHVIRVGFVTTDPRVADRLIAKIERTPGALIEYRRQTAGFTRDALRSRAAAIFKDYASGLSGGTVAAQHGVSVQTVSRIALDPARYGINAKPIRRVTPGRRT